MIAEIRDANLGYLMLAQQMIRSDKATAIFRLGISSEIADLIEGMNNAQILKLAGTNMMLARFRFDDGAILERLASFGGIIVAERPSEFTADARAKLVGTRVAKVAEWVRHALSHEHARHHHAH